MEKTINWWMPLLKGAAFVALGIFIINQPDESMKAILKTLGIALVLIGVALSTFSYYTRNTLSDFKSYLVMGVVITAIGLFIIFKENADLIIAIIFAVAIGFSGIVNFILSFNLKKWGSPYWFWTLVVSIFESVIALIFIFNPEIFGLTIITVLGVGMLIFGLLNILIGVNLKRSKNYFDSIVQEDQTED